MRIRKTSVFCVLSALLQLIPAQAAALDAHKALTQYGHDKWLSSQGLPQNSVLTMAQDGGGYLWLGTYEGLVRFDGVRFTVFDKQNTKELTANWVTALHYDQQGELWIGTIDGLLKRRGEHFERIGGLPNESISAITADPGKNLWIGTNGGGLHLLEPDGSVTSFTAEKNAMGDAIISLSFDRKGALYIGTSDKGLIRYANKIFTPLGKAEGFPEAPVLRILQDINNNLWIATRGDGLHLHAGNSSRIFNESDGLPSNTVNDIIQDRDNNLFVATSNGIARLSGEQFSALTPEAGAQSPDIRNLLEDPEGSLWMGTETEGLQRLRDGSFTTFSVDEGLSNNMVRSVLEDSAGTLWIATHGGGLNRFENGRVTQKYTAKDNIGGDVVWGLYEDSHKSLWIGTLGGGIGHIEAGQIHTLSKNEGLPVSVVSSFAEHGGALWLGSEGLVQYKDGIFTLWGPEQGMPKTVVNALLEDKNKTLWICTVAHGLGRMVNNQIEFFTSKNGLAGDNAVSLTEDADGVLWIATSGGLSRYKDGALKSFTREAGLYDSALHQVLVDDLGSLWMSTNKGIFSVRKSDIEAYEAGRIPSIPSRSFGAADGMKNAECNGGTQPAGFKRRDGTLWFATIEGVAVIDPKKLRQNPRPPPVHIERVVADNLEVAQGDTIKLSAGTRKLELNYTALSFLDPSKVVFKYKLEGYDTEWNQADKRRSAYYTNLAPGAYKFQVIASNNDGIWNQSGASLSFYLEPHFYQTNTFIALVILSFFLFVGGSYGVRINILKRRERALRAHNTELAQALAAAQEAARLKGEFVANISHELYTPLNSILNIPDGLLDMYSKQEIAECGGCHVRFELEAGDKVEADTECPECGAKGMLRLDTTWQFGGEFETIVKHLNTLKRSGIHLQNVINDVLDFSKLEAGKMTLQTQTVQVKSLFDDLSATLSPLAHQKKITLDFKQEPEHLSLEADPVKCAQILINLISNAIKFSHEGGLIEIRAHKDGDHCVFAVQDYGIGIAPEHHEAIFESFQQVDGSHTRRAGGTGLGLAIVKQLVQLHEGSISLSSELGRGATFSLRLPIESKSSLKKLPPEDEHLQNAEKRLILALDDEPIALETLKLALRPLNCEVIGLTDPGKLETFLSHKKPDLLILDIMMPRKSGLRLLRELKSSEQNKNIPILVSSAFRENRDLCISLGAVWLGKPYGSTELLTAVRAMLKTHPPAAQRARP